MKTQFKGGFRQGVQKYNSRLAKVYAVMLALIAFVCVASLTDSVEAISVASIMPFMVLRRDPSGNAGGGGAAIFSVKSNEELTKMEAEELAAYYNEYNNHLREKIENLEKDKASSEDIKGLRDELSNNVNEQIKNLNDILKIQGKTIARFKKGGLENGNKSFKECLKDALEANKDAIKDLSSRKKDGSKLVIPITKAAAIFSQSVNAGSGTTSEEVLPGISLQSRTRIGVIDVVNSMPTQAETIRFIEMANRDGDAAMQAENNALALIDFDITQNTSTVKMVGVRAKSTDQILRYVTDLEATIQSELVWRLRLKFSTQVLSGDNTGNNLKGIQEYATTFAAGNLANTVDEANKFDVLRAAVAQVRRNNVLRATEVYATPTVAVMHPDDVAGLQLKKDANNNYILPPFMSQDGTRVAGLTIIEDDSITADDFLVMDPMLSHFRFSEDKPIAVEIGYSDDDFEKGNVTMRLFTYATHYIKSNETGAFIKGDFTTAAAALETP